MNIIYCVLLSFFLALQVHAQDKQSSFTPIPTLGYGPYYLKVEKVLDGDTFKSIVLVWPKVRMKVTVRLSEIDTPEIHSKSKCEVELGTKAKNRTIELISLAQLIFIDNVIVGSFNRYRADVVLLIPGMAQPISLNATLVSEGLARMYKKGDKTPWCDDNAPNKDKAKAKGNFILDPNKPQIKM